MKLSIPVQATIQKRHSVRTYEEKDLLPQHRDALLHQMEQLQNPFGVTVHKHIVDKQLQTGGEKLGTYGVIKGARTFLGLSIHDTPLAPLAAGYEFENLILFATHMGLGTVWLAATFNRDAFSSAMGIQPDELFLAISPVGYPAAKRSVAESLMRSAMKSSARKDWGKLFFHENFHTPLTSAAADTYATPLEMVRLAPSAKNMQPWRICKVGNSYHFYVTYKAGTSKEEALIKQVDLGIALSHFHQTALELGLTGTFEVMPQPDITLPDHTYYVISWCADTP